MKIELTPEQKEQQAVFRAFVDQKIRPYADQYDQEEYLPRELIGEMAQQGYLGALLPGACQDTGMDMILFGLLNEEIGRGCSSARSLLTVHSMVGYAINRWANQDQKEFWLPRLANGNTIAAFALSELNVGSDAQSIETTATLADDGYVLDGSKKWITFGQIADLFLVFARLKGELAAFLVERNRPGFSTEPISGLLGARASMLAVVKMEHCLVPKQNLLGRTGFGTNAILFSALDIGRYSVAWGCVGIAQACLEASVQYTQQRKQFGVYLKEHQLIMRMIADMSVNLKAARLLCYSAGYLKENGNPEAMVEILAAKYFASTVAAKVSSDAVQIHGANGCSQDYSVQRYLRDAKIMEIIEGTSQIQQITIAKYAYT